MTPAGYQEPFRPLGEELDQWAQSARTALLWLRDDDATDRSPALEHLIELTERHAIPVALAVVPAVATPSLVQLCNQSAHLHPVVHGFAHRNHAPANERKMEFGPHRPRAVMLEELREGLVRSRELFGERLVPIFVPPWNRMDPELLPLLREAGYRALSGLGRIGEGSRSAIPVINVHVDLIDWRGTRTMRDPGTIATLVAGALQQARLSGGDAVGILSHHLVQDEADSDTLAELLTATSGHPACRWLSAPQLLKLAAVPEARE